MEIICSPKIYDVIIVGSGAGGGEPVRTNIPEDHWGTYPGGRTVHEVGCARMGADRRTSVLNPWRQAWDCKNLFITDGAPFVSNADKNPTLTILALACALRNTSPIR